MMLFMLALGGVAFTGLVVTHAVQSDHSRLSLYELRRRKETGDKAAAAALKREELLTQADGLRQPAAALLATVTTVALIRALGWQWGVVAALAAALAYARIADLSYIRRRVKKLIRQHEAASLALLTRHKRKLDIISNRPPDSQRALAFGSREELAHIISTSGTVLAESDKKLLISALAFGGRSVAGVMVARDAMVTVKHTELLGPLVLSDLHKTGHSCFPVVADTADDIIGVLDIRGLLTLEAKRSVTAAKAMSPGVVYINSTQTLDRALAIFVETRRQMLIVADKDGVTLGLLSLRDTLETLLGSPLNGADTAGSGAGQSS